MPPLPPPQTIENSCPLARNPVRNPVDLFNLPKTKGLLEALEIA